MNIRSLFLSLCLSLSALCSAEGRFVNPVTDVCWSCLFPITISGVQVSPGEDLADHTTVVCACAGTPPKVGIPVAFWEPSRMVDVTRKAYTLVGLGGIQVGDPSFRNNGTVGPIAGTSMRQSFYHVHWYFYPLVSWLEILTDFECITKGTLDVGYMSELDPLWNDEATNFILNPESALFANDAAQLACIADCAAASSGRPLDGLFWCAGCHGSLYPFTGFVGHHVGPIQASSLLVHRVIAKFHRAYLLTGYEPDQFCQAEYMPLIKKTLYKTQLLYPIPQTTGPCIPLGKSDLFWGAGKSFPVTGEDFIYLIWTKRQCCLDAVRVSIALKTGGQL